MLEGATCLLRFDRLLTSGANEQTKEEEQHSSHKHVPNDHRRVGACPPKQIDVGFPKESESYLMFDGLPHERTDGTERRKAEPPRDLQANSTAHLVEPGPNHECSQDVEHLEPPEFLRPSNDQDQPLETESSKPSEQHINR